MTQLIAKYAMRKVLGKEMEKYKSKKPGGLYDPFYEEIPHPTKPGKTKKVKKEIPAYISPHDADVLASARKTAYRLDYALFTFFGLRFGWSSVIGLMPAIGDAMDCLLALNLVLNMRKVEGGLPSSVFNRMIFNIIIDFTLGLVPFVGDLVDAAIKCNGKNVRLLEEHLDKVYKPQSIIQQEESMSKERRPRPASVYVDFDDEQDDHRNVFADPHNDVRQPTRAYSGRRDRLPDEERGVPRQDTNRSRRDERPSNSKKSSNRRY